MLGSVVLILHGHMPWVLNHGRWPHGETWLYEAAFGVYLPLLDLIEELDTEGISAGFTLGLTPVLLEQLAHPTFIAGFRDYLDDRLGHARRDASEPELAGLAVWWEERIIAARTQFDALDGNLPGAFAAHARAGRIEILSSLATHGYAPLLLHDSSIRGQLKAGLRVSERHLGFRPEGVWLPECAFRPAGPWTPPVVHGDTRNRLGVDQILAEVGVTHFVVDAHHFERIRSEGVIDGGQFRKVGWDEADAWPGRGWRSVMEPHRISTVGQASDVVAYPRHPRASEQVWAAEIGYPGDGAYLEFHKKRHGDGLRYWKVTRSGADLGEKALYWPDDVPQTIQRQAQHFVGILREELQAHREKTGRAGAVVAPFDAELFGHWWFEGPQFLREVLLALHADPEINVHTTTQRREAHPPDKVAWIPEGSWGEGGDHRVWLNDKTRWVWEASYRAEDRFLTLRWDLSQATPERAAVAEPILKKAARELLLLQASDWAFVIHTDGAVDYGFRRLSGHMTRFENLANLTWDLLQGHEMSDLQKLQVAEADAHDDCFSDLDLSDWD
ncbi:MAG: 1,4-alpha-glucan branching enzyme [Myxococcota bacterium]|jgi:1,4-alpha-glucan branching enzyme